MNELIQEVRAALEAGLYTLALQGTLALVDISAALNSPDGETTGPKFKAWFTDHLAEKFPRLNADDAWKLRCGLLHQGRTKSTQYAAIVFTYPTDGPGVMHNNIWNDALTFDVEIFCSDILYTVETWWHVYQYGEPQRSNAEDLIQRREDGLAPYVGGIPVLA